MLVKIVRRPIGEAPDWVRDAWIGLALTTPQTSPRTFSTIGVLTGSKSLFLQIGDLFMGRLVRVSGYVVGSRAAIDLLAESEPAAAQWWRDNAPQFLDGRSAFLFDAEACEPVAALNR